MDFLLTLGAGLLAGLVLSAPVGPMGLLALLKLGQRRRHEAYAIGAGATLADGMLATVAALGIPAVAVRLEVLVRMLPGGDWMLGHVVRPEVAWGLLAAVLLVVAFSLWRVQPDVPGGQQASRHMLNEGRALATGFVATVLHAGNLTAFAAAFLWLEHQGLTLDSLSERATLGVAVTVGTGAMWLLMLQVVQRYMERHDVRHLLQHVRVGLAGIIVLMAILAAGKAVAQVL